MFSKLSLLTLAAGAACAGADSVFAGAAAGFCSAGAEAFAGALPATSNTKISEPVFTLSPAATLIS